MRRYVVTGLGLALALITVERIMAASTPAFDGPECELTVEPPLVRVAWKDAHTGQVLAAQNGRLELSATNGVDRPLMFRVIAHGRFTDHRPTVVLHEALVQPGAVIETFLELEALQVDFARQRFPGDLVVELRAETEDGMLFDRDLTARLYLASGPRPGEISVHDDELTLPETQDFAAVQSMAAHVLGWFQQEHPNVQYRLGRAVEAFRSRTVAPRAGVGVEP